MQTNQTGRVRAYRGAIRAMSFVAAILIAVFGLTMIGGSAYADNEKTDKYDFYTLSSNVTAYFSEATKPGEGTGLSADEGWDKIAENASEGGALLGYGDDDVSSFAGWLVSKATGASNTVGYDSLKVRDKLYVWWCSCIRAVWLTVECVGSRCHIDWSGAPSPEHAVRIHYGVAVHARWWH